MDPCSGRLGGIEKEGSWQPRFRGLAAVRFLSPPHGPAKELKPWPHSLVVGGGRPFRTLRKFPLARKGASTYLPPPPTSTRHFEINTDPSQQKCLSALRRSASPARYVK